MQCQAPAPLLRAELRHEAGIQGQAVLYGQHVPRCAFTVVSNPSDTVPT